MATSKRYGDILPIAHKTDCRCHLCGGRVDLDTYGQADIYGGEAASVDHLWPQSLGVDDDPDNLRIAHQGCNSSRGVRDPDEYRMERYGRSSEPWSSTNWAVAGVAAPLGVGALCGAAFAKEEPDGSRTFNTQAAFVGGLAALFLIGIARAA